MTKKLLTKVERLWMKGETIIIYVIEKVKFQKIPFLGVEHIILN